MDGLFLSLETGAETTVTQGATQNSLPQTEQGENVNLLRISYFRATRGRETAGVKSLLLLLKTKLLNIDSLLERHALFH